MPSSCSNEVYSPREIARAAGVSEEEVRAALGRPKAADVLVSHADAVRLGRTLSVAAGVSRTSPPLGAVSSRAPESLFSLFGSRRASARSRGVPLALSGTLHVGMVASAIIVTSLGLAPTATRLSDRPAADMRFVFLSTPGPGGGGGGGGLRQQAPPPKALREGRRALSSPMPLRQPPRPIEPTPPPPEPTPPPLNSEPLPAVVAPIIAAQANNRDRIGVLQEAIAERDSRGPGEGGGVGTGKGTGLGRGDGSGVGPGSGGGTGGGPYRPGSGIEPPRLLREVKAGYTDDGRRRGIEGEVTLEIVVRRDGTVGDVTLQHRLGAGLDERATQAVRQWRFAPATRHGSPVDVIVEVAVEFRLR